MLIDLQGIFFIGGRGQPRLARIRVNQVSALHTTEQSQYSCVPHSTCQHEVDVLAEIMS